MLRLNYDGRGDYLGEFGPTDLVLVIMKSGEFYTTTFDAGNHFDEGIMRIELFRPKHVWTALLYDDDQKGLPYMKRFTFEPSNRRQRFVGDSAASTLIALSDAPGARFEVVFGGGDSFREPLEIIASEFIAVKSFKAKGKRITNYEIAEIRELEPLGGGEEAEEPDDAENPADAPETTDIPDVDDGKSEEEVRDEITGQQRIF